ncbi:MAG TPA: AI-2E family transporter [Gemmatimonadaceae bacterium]|nr:AI-2E family transporter [Gemmatimonadaceae bacterium]
MAKDDADVAGNAANSARPPSSALDPAVNVDATATKGPHGEPAPDISRTEAAVTGQTTRSFSLVILAVLATFYTMYFARQFFVPIVLAVLLNFLLSPVIRMLARVRIPPPAGAAIVVLLLIGAVGIGVYSLAGPAQTLAASAPEALAKANTKIRKLFLARVQNATSQVERAAGALGDSVGQRVPRQIIVNNTPTISSRLLGTTQLLIAGILEIVILLYFLLAGGDLFLQKFVKVLPHYGDKQKAVEIARATEAAVSTYLSTALVVNISEGVVVALLLWALKMPSPAVWGVMVAAVEFVPYLGALTGVVILGLAGLTTFDNIGHALLIPGSFLAVNTIQANLVTPMLLGHRLTLNPVAIFVGLTFFFWIWGVAGAFLAVPLLATLKIFCDNIGPLAALGELLGERDDSERRIMIRRPTR